MNRNDEFTELMRELDESVPEVRESIQRGSRRKARKQFLYQPLMCLVAVFAVFVLSVNFCAPVAEACAKVPFLRELAEAVKFSKSLSTAVDNEYVQEMNLKQTKGDVTVEIPYLIVDRKQVNVFYRFESATYACLDAYCDLLDENGEEMNGYSVLGAEHGLANEELRHASIDFSNRDVPGKLNLRMEIYAYDEEGNRSECIDVFVFLLEFDPTFTEQGKKYPVNQSFIIDGQTLTVTEIEVYPTHMRINVTDAPENTAWFKGLEFYVENGEGESFSNNANGMLSFGSSQEDDVVSYYAESPYFYEAEHLKMVITGVDWLEKGMEETWVDLKTEETGPLPEDTVLKEIQRTDDGRVKLIFEQSHIGGNSYCASLGYFGYDTDGNLYSFTVMMDGDTGLEIGEEGRISVGYLLDEYPHEKIRMELQYSERCRLEQEVVVDLK